MLVSFIDKNGAVAGAIFLSEKMSTFVETIRQTAIARGFTIDMTATMSPDAVTLYSILEIEAYLETLRT